MPRGGHRQPGVDKMRYSVAILWGNYPAKNPEMPYAGHRRLPQRLPRKRAA
jgi:hypothetical protein